MPIRRLKLWHFPASRSARVKWMLHEVVGDAFEVERPAFASAFADAGEFRPEVPQDPARPSRFTG